MVHFLTKDHGDIDTERLVNTRYKEIANSTHNSEAAELGTPREIKKALLRTGSRKAPGHDGIQNILLKNMPEKAFVHITYIFDSRLLLCYFPNAWKTANILPFHKAGMDKLFPASYRPVSLLPPLAKVFERIIYNRFLHFENMNKLLIPEQFGLRQNRSTVQQLIRLLTTISTISTKIFLWSWLSLTW